MIRFQCPTCNKVLKAPDGGRETTCPKCGQRLIAPPLSQPTNRTIMGRSLPDPGTAHVPHRAATPDWLADLERAAKIDTPPGPRRQPDAPDADKSVWRRPVKDPEPPATKPLSVSLVGPGCAGLAILFWVVVCASFVQFVRRSGGERLPADVIERAHQRGAEVGREEGRRAGEAEGYAAAFNAAEAESYRDTINHLYQDRQYHRSTSFTLTLVFSFFLCGFGLQWVALYLPRRAGFLRDIDWIILPKEMTRVDLNDVGAGAFTGTKLLVFLRDCSKRGEFLQRAA